MKDDGGPAFPTHMLNVPFNEADDPKHNGMSLRDYFAGQALASIAESGIVQNFEEIHIASVAYRLADAMLEAREAKETEDEGLTPEELESAAPDHCLGEDN